MRRELLGFWLALHLHDMEGILQTTCACAFICLEASGWWHGNAAGTLQGPAHGSETLGLASGPATHQPFDLGHVHKQKYSMVNHLNFEMFKTLQDIFAMRANPLLGSALKKFYLTQLESDL